MGKLGELSIAADARSIPDILRIVAGHATALGFGEKRVGEIASAVAEAIGNVIDYAYGSAKGDVHLLCKEDQGGRFVIVIADDADPLNVLLSDDAWPTPKPESTATKGPSTRLMKRYAGNIEYRRMDDRNILTFTISRSLR